ncbi:MAG TPA: dihydroorotase [Gammaproteobacteria bacterium]|nr:dihydroorotase [Gammaproteobacteria bacterium]
MRITIRAGRVIDPANGVDRVQDLHIAEGRIFALGAAPDGFSADQIISAEARIVCPGLVDLCARLREPGAEHKATIASETAAAASAGITSLCCPPDTHPVIDTPAVAELIHQRAEHAGQARVYTLGALTKGLAGTHLSEMISLKEAGCVGLSNGLQPISNTQVMRRAMEYAATHGLTVFLHAEDAWLRNRGCAHEGAVSTRLGLPGIPESAETAAVARDLILIEQTGVRAHFAHLSSARAAQMVGRAQHDGLPVSADVSAHHLHLTEMDVSDFNSDCHVIPPLRTMRDRDGLRKGLAAGVISAVCSDHQPHDADAKLSPFMTTAPGISALETLLPLTLHLVNEGVLSLSEALARLTHLPAQILGIDAGSLAVGKIADICIFDPDHYWTFDKTHMQSRGKNSPFTGWEFKGRVTHTLLGGRLVYALQPCSR